MIFYNVWDNPSHLLIFFRRVETYININMICMFLNQYIQDIPGYTLLSLHKAAERKTWDTIWLFNVAMEHYHV